MGDALPFYCGDGAILEREADGLLRRHGKVSRRQGVYVEEDLARRLYQEISSGVDFEWDEETLIPEARNITLAEVIAEAHLTQRQHQAVWLKRRLGTQQRTADAMQITRSEVSRLLSRSFVRIRAAMNRLIERHPSPEAEMLFADELLHKLAIIYRRPHGVWDRRLALSKPRKRSTEPRTSPGSDEPGRSAEGAHLSGTTNASISERR